MNPIFNLATNVMQACVFIFPTEIHFSHPHRSREEKASSGKDIHMSDFERSKNGKAMNNLFCAELSKIPNLQGNMEGA